MGIVFSHETARDYYRMVAIGVIPGPTVCNQTALGWKPHLSALPAGHVFRRAGFTVGELERFGVYPAPIWPHGRADVSEEEAQRALDKLDHPNDLAFSLGGPLDVITASAAGRPHDAQLASHIFSQELPCGSLRRVGRDACVPAPELLYLQMAPVLREEHLVAAFGCELCGTYSLLPRGLVSLSSLLDGPARAGTLTLDDLRSGDPYVVREPLTTRAELAAFLAQLPKHTRGLRLAKRSLRWVKDGSRTPMETAGSLSLRMRSTSGGFCLGRSLCNVRQPIATAWQDALQVPYLLVDELYRSSRHAVAVEYVRRRGPRDRLQAKEDSQRVAALEEAGLRVCLVSEQSFADFSRWSLLAESLARTLGKRPASSEKVLERQRRVHADLCDPDLLR